TAAAGFLDGRADLGGTRETEVDRHAGERVRGRRHLHRVRAGPALREALAMGLRVDGKVANELADLGRSQRVPQHLDVALVDVTVDIRGAGRDRLHLARGG